MHIPTPKNALTLSNLYQGPAESLKSYLSRFNVALAEVKDPDPCTVLYQLAKGVLPTSEFGAWIDRKQPKSLDAFHEKARQYLCQEEAR